MDTVLEDEEGGGSFGLDVDIDDSLDLCFRFFGEDVGGLIAFLFDVDI